MPHSDTPSLPQTHPTGAPQLGACLAFLAFLAGFLPGLRAATYYIDYASGSDNNAGTSTNAPFQTCPGMATFPRANYTPGPGDVFVFKGGVTWPAATLPLNVLASGVPGSPTTYTANSNWYAGASWTRPILNGNMILGPNGVGIYDNLKSDILIDDLEVLNVGDTNTGSGTGIEIFDANDIEVRNCWLQPEGLQAFVYANSVVAPNHIYFHDNHISRAGRTVIYGTQGLPVGDLRIYNNVYEGPANTQIQGYHADGFMIGVPNHPAISNAAVVNLLFYNNYFYGDWSAVATGQFYSLGGLSNVFMYNNVFAYENTTCPAGSVLSPGFVYFQNDANLAIYNNTFSADAFTGYNAASNIMNGVAGALWVGTPWSNTPVVIEGNIFSMCHIGIELDSDPPALYTINYNLYNPDTTHFGDLIWYGNTQCKSLAAAQALGFEKDSPSMAPAQFVKIPAGAFVLGSGNWQLLTNSPALNALPATAAPTNLFSSSLLGVLRPQQKGSWDLGAYQHQTTSIDPPQNLHIVSNQ